MTKKKSLKTALLMSGLSMLLCSAMLAGTTFAWFSDTATSGENTIVAGNLHVGLEYNDSENFADNGSISETWNAEGNWKDATGKALFDEGISWEPGVMVISTPFRVKNTGDLTLEYKIDVKCEYNKTDDGKSLEDVVQIKVVTLSDIVGQGYDRPMTGDTVDRVALWSSAIAIPESATLAGEATSDAFVVMMYWQPNAEAFDNLYNNVKDAEGALLNIKCKIVVTAKQAASEADSVDSDYDKNATYPAAE